MTTTRIEFFGRKKHSEQLAKKNDCDKKNDARKFNCVDEIESINEIKT